MVESKKKLSKSKRNLGEIPVKQDAITDECSIFKQKMVLFESKNINYIFWLLNLTVKSKKNTWVSLAFCQRCLIVLKRGTVRKGKEWNREEILKILFNTQTEHIMISSGQLEKDKRDMKLV